MHGQSLSSHSNTMLQMDKLMIQWPSLVAASPNLHHQTKHLAHGWSYLISNPQSWKAPKSSTLRANGTKVAMPPSMLIVCTINTSMKPVPSTSEQPTTPPLAIGFTFFLLSDSRNATSEEFVRETSCSSSCRDLLGVKRAPASVECKRVERSRQLDHDRVVKNDPNHEISAQRTLTRKLMSKYRRNTK